MIVKKLPKNKKIKLKLRKLLTLKINLEIEFDKASNI